MVLELLNIHIAKISVVFRMFLADQPQNSNDSISMKECGSLWMCKISLFSWYIKDASSRVLKPTRPSYQFFKSKKNKVVNYFGKKKMYRSHRGGTGFQGVLFVQK